jgi:hypothetical protein
MLPFFIWKFSSFKLGQDTSCPERNVAELLQHSVCKQPTIASTYFPLYYSPVILGMAAVVSAADIDSDGLYWYEEGPV